MRHRGRRSGEKNGFRKSATTVDDGNLHENSFLRFRKWCIISRASAFPFWKMTAYEVCMIRKKGLYLYLLWHRCVSTSVGSARRNSAWKRTLIHRAICSYSVLQRLCQNERRTLDWVTFLTLSVLRIFEAVVFSSRCVTGFFHLLIPYPPHRIGTVGITIGIGENTCGTNAVYWAIAKIFPL